MTQEEILQYNKRCAEFLGMDNDAFLLAKQIEKNTGICHLKFHSDWNWIMEVVEAIEHKTIEGYPYRFETKNGYVWFLNELADKDSIIIQTEINSSLKEAVVEAINQFLIWYNENN